MKINSWKNSKSPIRRGQRAATISHAFDFWSEQLTIENKTLQKYDFWFFDMKTY